MIIDKNTKGLKFNGLSYEFNGNLIADILDIKINIYSTSITGTVKKIFGFEIKTFLSITSEKWPIRIFDKHMKIGCELHTIKEWENFTDGKINSMDSQALSFWKSKKSFLLKICATVK